MELDLFIRELLFQHDCVIVPDFGGFVANYRPAYINYDLNTFSPPAKDISFNRSLTNNDGLLIGYISEKKGMSYVDTRKWVSSQVKEWKRKLEKGRKIEVKDVGVFQMGKDRNLLFEPLNTVNFLADAYGLAEFQMVPLEELQKTKAAAGRIALKKPEDARSRKTLRRVLIAVPIVAALIVIPLTTNLVPVDFSSLNPFSHKTVKQVTVQPAAPKVKKEKALQPAAVKKEKEKMTPQAEKKEVPPEAAVSAAKEEKKTAPPVAETKSAETGKPAETTDAEKTVTENTPAGTPAVADRVVDKSSMYYVVAGSFKNRANAGVLKKELEQEDYRVVILNGPKGFYRVAIGGFTDKTTAVGILKEQKRKKAGESYWLLKK